MSWKTAEEEKRISDKIENIMVSNPAREKALREKSEAAKRRQKEIDSLSKGGRSKKGKSYKLPDQGDTSNIDISKWEKESRAETTSVRIEGEYSKADAERLREQAAASDYLYNVRTVRSGDKYAVVGKYKGDKSKLKDDWKSQARQDIQETGKTVIAGREFSGEEAAEIDEELDVSQGRGMHDKLEDARESNVKAIQDAPWNTPPADMGDVKQGTVTGLGDPFVAGPGEPGANFSSLETQRTEQQIIARSKSMQKIAGVDTFESYVEKTGADPTQSSSARFSQGQTEGYLNFEKDLLSAFTNSKNVDVTYVPHNVEKVAVDMGDKARVALTENPYKTAGYATGAAANILSFVYGGKAVSEAGKVASRVTGKVAGGGSKGAITASIEYSEVFADAGGQVAKGRARVVTKAGKEGKAGRFVTDVDADYVKVGGGKDYDLWVGKQEITTYAKAGGKEALKGKGMTAEVVSNVADNVRVGNQVGRQVMEGGPPTYSFRQTVTKDVLKETFDSPVIKQASRDMVAQVADRTRSVSASSGSSTTGRMVSDLDKPVADSALMKVAGRKPEIADNAALGLQDTYTVVPKAKDFLIKSGKAALDTKGTPSQSSAVDMAMKQGEQAAKAALEASGPKVAAPVPGLLKAAGPRQRGNLRMRTSAQIPDVPKLRDIDDYGYGEGWDMTEEKAKVIVSATRSGSSLRSSYRMDIAESGREKFRQAVNKARKNHSRMAQGVSQMPRDREMVNQGIRQAVAQGQKQGVASPVSAPPVPPPITIGGLPPIVPPPVTNTPEWTKKKSQWNPPKVDYGYTRSLAGALEMVKPTKDPGLLARKGFGFRPKWVKDDKKKRRKKR